MLTRENFSNWLSNYSDKSNVGGDYGCPVHKFLKDHYAPVDEVLIGYTPENDVLVGTVIYEDGREFELPNWATRFVDETDSLNKARVTAKDARKVLDRVLSE
jgi:hypothetical protein